MNDSGPRLPRRDRHRREDALHVLQLGADRLDPQLVGIDDFEQRLARVHHLAQMHIGGGDDAGDRSFQRLAGRRQAAAQRGAPSMPPARR